MTTKPWKEKTWKDRRSDILSGKCMWCGSVKPPFVLHHWDCGGVETQEQYERYKNLVEGDFVTICKACHFVWTRYRKVYCPACGIRRRRPVFALCYWCETKKELTSKI